MNATPLQPTIDIRRADDRFKTRIGWLDSKHSFSFSRHWDPDNTHHGLLLVNNDDIVLPGTGFETHPHRDMEIVTWVLQGSLVHQDSTGTAGVIYPGLAQRMSAGTGILHSEKNDSWRVDGGDAHDEPVRFIQMWVIPDEQLGRITADITLVHGRNDLPCPAQATSVRLAQGIQHANLVLLSNCGHAPAAERPDEVCAALRLAFARHVAF